MYAFFEKSPGNHHCVGAAGQLLIFHLPFKANSSLLIMKDDKHRILTTNHQGKIKLNKEFADQSQSINNGTLKLGKAMKKHSGY